MNKTSRRRCLILASTVLTALLIAIPGLGGPLLPPTLAGKAGELAAHNLLEIILTDLAQQHDALIKIQRELVRRPGINPEDGGDGEEEKARWIEDWLAAEKLPQAERVDCPDDRVSAKIRPNLILRHPNPADDRPTFWVVAYLDNAPPGNMNEWTGSPTSLRVDGDLIFGLGVQGNNDAIAASLLLLRTLHRYAAVAPFNFGVLLVSHEKKGSRYGFLHVLDKRPNLFTSSDRFLVLSYGKEDGAVIEVGEKGALFLKITVHGQQTHSGTPHMGKNALAAGAGIIAGLPSVSEQFSARNSLFEPPYSTFTPTMPQAPETTFNQIPGEFSFCVDIRLLPDYRLEEARAAVTELAEEVGRQHGVSVVVSPMEGVYPPAPMVPPDAPEVRAVEKAIQKQLGIEPRLCGIGGITLATTLRHLGFNALVWRAARFQEHSANESMSIRNNLNEAAVMARLLFDRELADSPPPTAENKKNAPERGL